MTDARTRVRASVNPAGGQKPPAADQLPEAPGRRALLRALLAALPAFALPVFGQKGAAVPRVGFLEAGSASANQHFLDAFKAGLRELGYVPPRNIVIDVRWAAGQPDRFAPLLAELIGLRPDVLVVASHVGAIAAKAATTSIPVVFVGASDPVGSGLVESLARPGGNVTGFSRAVEDGTIGKAVQLLADVAPSAARVALLWNPSAAIERRRQEAIAAVRALGMTPVSFEIRDAKGLDRVFAEMSRQRVGALFTLVDPLTLVNRMTIVRLAATHRIPAVYEFGEFVRSGGLIAYAPSTVILFRLAASYVDKILGGASPAELPIQQPTVFELVVNLKAAKALGITIPQSLLVRADEVIE